MVWFHSFPRFAVRMALPEDAWRVVAGHVETERELCALACTSRELRRVLDRISPTPILLYTVTQDGDPTMAELNTVIRGIGDEYPNAVVVDWGAAVAFEEILDLAEDGLPTTDGMGRIVLLTAAALGEPPPPANGACLESRFTDDSAIVIDS